MKKILSTFLLSAMLVLVLGGCESEEQKQIERLEKSVEILTDNRSTLAARLRECD